MKLGEAAANAALSIGSVLVLVVGVELCLQLLVPLLFRPRFTVIDEELGWLHNRSVSHTAETEGHRYRLSYNAHGFRPPERSYEKPDGTLRIVVIGDSFVDGAEVGDEEVFTWLLDRCLPEVEVINLGVYAYQTTQELLLLERFGFSYSPDLVLLLTISNDYLGNPMALESFGPAPRFMPDGDGLRLEGTDHPAAREAFRQTNLPATSLIHRHSLVYWMLNRYLYQPLIGERILEVRRARAAEVPPDQVLELYRRIVVRMSESAERRGAELVVAFGYLRPELLKEGGSPNASIRSELEAAGIRTLDLFDGLREAETSSEESLYYREDIHWNAHGNRVVADLLAPALRRWKNGDPLPDPPTRGECAAPRP